jgi:spore protease
LEEKFLGVKVLSVGVPMVTHAAVIACDLIEAAFDKSVEEEDINQLFSAINATKGSDLIVTPKNIDIIVEKASTMVSMALNIALNPGFDAETAAMIADI